MIFVLDTSVAIALWDEGSMALPRVADLGEAVLSIVTRVELEAGVVRKSDEAAGRRIRLARILEQFPTLPFDDACADAYGGILASVGFSRRRVLDRMIAAQALVHRATLVTLNGDDFRDVPGLDLLEW